MLVRNATRGSADSAGSATLQVSFRSSEGFRARGEALYAPPMGVPGPLTVPERQADEYLMFAASSQVVVARSWADAGDGLPVGGQGVIGLPQDEGGVDEFLVRLAPSPDFLYERTEVSEYLVSYGTGADDAREASLRLTELAASVSHEVAHPRASASEDPGSPILFMQAPVAPYRAVRHESIGDGSRERPRDILDNTLRIGIAFPRAAPRARQRFERWLLQFCLDRDYGLDVGDRRPNRVRGDWFGTSPHHSRKTTAGVPSSRRPHEAYRPLTFLGPARVGSSAAIFASLQELGAGLSGLSVSALGDVAVINLAVLGAVSEYIVKREGEDEFFTGFDNIDSAIRSSLALPANTGPARPLGRASDYFFLAGRLRVPVTEKQGRHLAVWASWRCGDTDQHKLVDSIGQELSQALQSAVGGRAVGSSETACIYARASRSPAGETRGRAKFGLPVLLSPEMTIIDSPLLTAICESAELRARKLLALNGTRNVDLRISWRERDLGRLSFPL